jgi:hypothetical protein
MLHAAVSTVQYAGSRRRPLPHREEGELEFGWCFEAHPQSHKRELLSRHLKW